MTIDYHSLEDAQEEIVRLMRDLNERVQGGEHPYAALSVAFFPEGVLLSHVLGRHPKEGE